MAETKQERSERLRRDVIKHDSYAVVAQMEGLTRERVRQLAGNGLTSQSRGPQPGICIDCKRKYKAIMRPGHDGRCERCRYFMEKYGQPWSPKTAKQVRQRTHCKYGHELTEENIYYSRSAKTGRITRACRICKRRSVNDWYQSPEGKEMVREQQQRYYQGVKQDPERWQKFMETKRKWLRTSPKSPYLRYKNDPEYRERILEKQRKHYRKQRDNQSLPRKEN